MSKLLAGRVAVATGGSLGIGRAAALAFAGASGGKLVERTKPECRVQG